MEDNGKLCVVYCAGKWWIGFASENSITARSTGIEAAREIGWRHLYPDRFTHDATVRVRYWYERDSELSNSRGWLQNGVVADFLVGPKQPFVVWVRPEFFSWLSDEAHARLADWLRGDDPLPDPPALVFAPSKS